MSTPGETRIVDYQRRLKAAAQTLTTRRPELLQANVGRACHEFLVGVKEIMADAWLAFVGKTTRDGGKWAPPTFRPRTVTYRGRAVDVVSLSHDCLVWAPEEALEGFPDGVQFDVLGSANWWDVPYVDPGTHQKATAFVSCGVIPAEEYRDWNPPIFELGLAAEPAPAPVLTGPPARSLDFPPRDYSLRFLEDLDAEYARRGRGDRTSRDGEIGPGAREGLHVDNEGLAVWLAEFLRRWATGDFPPVIFALSEPAQRLFEKKYVAVRDAVLADVARAWR